MEAENKYSRAMRGAPADSLFGQFCLHALWFGNCNIRGAYYCLLLFYFIFLLESFIDKRLGFYASNCCTVD
jgi:hypothetical protein